MVFRLLKMFFFIFCPEFDFFQLVANRSWDRIYISFDLLKKSHNYNFVVLKYLFWNEITLFVTYDVIITNVSSEAAVRNVPQKRCCS